MSQITVESEALDSLKAMAQRLQEERDELLAQLIKAAKTLDVCRYSEQPMAKECFALIAKCTEKPEVLE